VKSFADKWLPILLRSTIGTAIHEFIQSNTNQFTEGEVSLKIPSIKFSGRLDNLIGPNILIEIKSCTYADYEKIIRTRKPRVSDFYQAIVYKYILENILMRLEIQIFRFVKELVNQNSKNTILIQSNLSMLLMILLQPMLIVFPRH